MRWGFSNMRVAIFYHSARIINETRSESNLGCFVYNKLKWREEGGGARE